MVTNIIRTISVSVVDWSNTMPSLLFLRTLRAAAGGGGSASYLLPTLHYGFLPLVHTGDTHTHRGVLLLPCLLSPQASSRRVCRYINLGWWWTAKNRICNLRAILFMQGGASRVEAEERRGGGDVKDFVPRKQINVKKPMEETGWGTPPSFKVTKHWWGPTVWITG